MTPVPELEEARAAARPMPGHTLPLGLRLRDYEITGLIGEGPWGVVYLAWDHSLQRKVAVKEYMPVALATRAGSTAVVVKLERHLDTFRSGLKSFVNEARLLARFDHPSLVKVYRFWEENGTAYMVMPYYEGPSLKSALADLGHVPSEGELRTWLKPILDAVTVLHEGGTWHQNIGPDEILLTPFGPVLLGFASAAHAVEAINHTPAAALKPGFAAIEQYGSEAGSTRGPWTDLYALAAVIYAAVTGTDPAAAADRLANDRLRPLAVVAAGLYGERFLAAIDAAMAIQPKQRPAKHTEFRALMGDIEAPQAVSLAPRQDLMQEPFVGAPASEREITVPDRPAVAPIPAVAAAAAEAKPAARAVAAKAPEPERAVPSWMRAGNVRTLGKRALYGVVAATCALIGIAALVLQFATRPTRVPLATAAVHAASAPLVATPTAAATTTTAPLALPAATPKPNLAAASTATPRPTVAAATPRAVPLPAATSPAPVAVALPTPGPTAPPTTPPAATRASAPAVAALASAAPAPSVPPIDRQVRCIEILQKASLEKITPAETDFFKQECNR